MDPYVNVLMVGESGVLELDVAKIVVDEIDVCKYFRHEPKFTL